MENLFVKNTLLVVLSLTAISPLFWAFFEGSLSYVIYLFSLLIIWVVYLRRIAKKLDNQK